MAEFNYREFLKNNPLLKEEVKDSLIIESKQPESIFKEDSKPKTSISSAEFERIKNSPEIEKLAAAVAKDPKAVANIEKVIQKSGALNEMAGDIEATDISKIAQAIDTLNEEEVGGGAPILIGFMGTGVALLATDALEMVNNLLNLPAASVVGGLAAVAAGAVLGAVYSKIKGLKENEEVKPSSKMKVSEFKAKIKEEILAALTEADEEEEVDVEDVEAEMDVEEPVVAPEIAPEEGLTSDEQEIQDSLKIAYDNAVQIGDDKLADQIGNTITFFTRSHVVNK